MASFRRTLSSSNYLTGGANSFSLDVNSPPHKLQSIGKSSSPLWAFGFAIGNLLGGGVRHSRKGFSWKKSIYRCLMFFFVGILLGVAPFGDLEDAKNKDGFSAQAKPPSIDDEREMKDVVIPRHNSIVAVSLLEVQEKTELEGRFDLIPRKQLIVVTPTYPRPQQTYDLNRLGQVLRLVQPPLLWIVVEMNEASSGTAEILRKTGVVYRHLVCSKNMEDVKHKKAVMRNTALEHVEHHRLDGIVYFADDDNVYSLELFDSMRSISRFGTWPVAMVAQSKNKVLVEGPICNGSRVVGWHTNEKSKRLKRFQGIDMSGFAFNSTLLWDPKMWHLPTAEPIRQLDTIKDGFQVSFLCLNNPS
ncbi:unnamed protein product [Cuscuta campestris]|uniref:Glycosyltransferases n=1 Tax=Cuscuta campestris TaxID=132261 RepID=A0A484KCM9_9ASTE|nr:unnamed protein product [Cuscuta campestris]